ncbi:hypothetical protein BN85408340 [Alteracholeplasma palmae J233]|uniref:Uncharacterized protein n=1 Tax=Alteracholeplasma palmae (strain ATCC 49389 / J233) TaxID=1318466 RepID=U4KRS8_ALTPJ|nr:hypothetical protein [Alteracholeplasma palmae]CCV64411.1 hypothetical protein BN85408340 [Alteracholeplasma palmae J233]
MNKSMFQLIKYGMKETRKAFKTNRASFYSYLTYVLSMIISMASVFLYPLFALSEVKIVKMMEEDNQFSVESSFSNTDKPNKYWTALGYFAVKLLRSIVTTGIFVGLIFLFKELGFQIDILLEFEKEYVTFIFTLITAIVGLIVLVRQNLLMAPIFYIIATENTSMSQAYSKGIEVMKKRGKTKLLLIQIISLIRAAFYIGFFVGFLMIGKEYLETELLVSLTVIFILMLIFILPKIWLAYKVSSITHFKQLVDDYNNENIEITEETYIERQVKESREKLDILFRADEPDSNL